MSVYKSKRSVSKIEFIKIGQQINVYTIEQIKKFPKSYRFTIVNDLYRLSTEIHESVLRANAIYMHKNMEKSEYLLRRTFQYSDDEVVILSFKDFYKYYQLDSNSWVVKKDSLKKLKRGAYSPIKCRIKFTSYWRYLLFSDKLQNERYTKKQKETCIEFLEEVQKDIDNCRAKSQKI